MKQGNCTQETLRCHGPQPCCHDHFLEMLDFVDQLFKKEGIPYWINFGTLLGAVRSGDIIPWDTDLDTGFWEEDIPRVLELLPLFEAQGYHHHIGYCGGNGKEVNPITIYYSETNKCPLSLSVFAKWRGMGHQVTWAGCYWPLADLKNLTTVKIRGKEYPCPNRPEFGLEQFYGPDWRTPAVKHWIKEYNNHGGLASTIAVVNDLPEYNYESGRQVGFLDKIKTAGTNFRGMVVYTAGTWDLFHVGHLNMITRAAKCGDKLIVGVSTDELVQVYKQRKPINSFNERLKILFALECPDTVVAQSQQFDLGMMKQLGVDTVVMGMDWVNSDNPQLAVLKENLQVIFLPRTDGISTTEIKHRINTG